jgi:superfamily II DNA or RNA helicase
MQSALLPGFDPATLASAVGAAAFAKGFQYAQQQAVVHAEWNASECALRGLVRGQGGHFYATAAFFSLSTALPPVFELAECSCPVEFNCKHAVALILTATAEMGPATAPLREQSCAVGWEHSLDALLGSRSGAPAARVAKTPLAIELTLVASGRQALGDGIGAGTRQLRLYGRLVRPGKNVGWISGGLSWSKLDSLSYSGEYVPEQVRLLRELHALYRSRGRYTTYNGYSYGSYGDDRSIEISAVDSRQLWPLIDEADSAGLRLVYARKLGTVPRYDSAELCLDITRRDASGPLVVDPVISAGEPPSSVVPLAFIGGAGGAHGLVYLERGEADAGDDPSGWRFRLARLSKAASPQLQQMALTGQRLEVPAADESRFLDSYYPRLRRAATLASSDGSFSPPPIEGPELVLCARYGPGHDVEVSWEWGYRLGDSSLRAPLDDEASDDGYRDPAAEQELLANLDLPLDRFGLARRDRKTPGSPLTLLARARLKGLDTMRFTTELLPLFADHPGVSTDITGEPADYREAGDSLRIAVATDEVAGDVDWFDLGVMISVEGRQVPFLDVFLALSRGEPYLLLPDGAYFSLDKPELQALRRLIEEARALQEASFGELRISRYQAGLWEELAGLGVIDHQASAWREQVSGLLSATGVRRPELPSGMHARLRPYQHDGFGWLAFLWEHRLGGILADDMGLGKTLESLALICHAKQAAPGTPPFLIVAPTSVVANWAAEAARFAPGLKVVPVIDTVSRRGRSLGELVAGADAVVTSYALLRIDFAAYAELSWAGLFLDEAQNVKNRQSKIYQCVRRLVAPVKIAITGTPLENNLMELWSLLSITAPGLFPNPVSFSDFYAGPIEKDGDAELLAQLQRRIKPLVKRRTKQQVVADLPAKQEQVLEIDLHPQHRKVYETHLQRERQKVLGLIHDMNANRFTIFRSLTLLRQLSLHAGLVDDAYHGLPSAKIDALLSQLGEVTGGGHRALVFSQFTGFLGKVRAELDALGVQYCYLDGSTRNRPQVIEQFKGGAAPVFLISLKAGGFGLNLAEADYCFLLDPWWNPATEAQAVDRIHRIGQTRNVMVYRLVARDTIEEKVMALKARKAKLFSSVMDHGDVFSAAIDAVDIRRLLA